MGIWGIAKRWLLLVLAVLVVGACGGSSGGEPLSRASVEGPVSTESTTTSEATTTTSTVPPPLFEPRPADPALTPEEQVEAAYLFYWEVMEHAFAEGDPSYFPLVLVDSGLNARIRNLDTYVSEGERYLFEIEHDFGVLLTASDEAVIADLQQSRFETVDAASGEVLDIEVNIDVPWVYWLTLREGTWYVYEFYIEGQP